MNHPEAFKAIVECSSMMVEGLFMNVVRGLGFLCKGSQTLFFDVKSALDGYTSSHKIFVLTFYLTMPSDKIAKYPLVERDPS